jgi:signal transduction histidine kinase
MSKLVERRRLKPESGLRRAEDETTLLTEAISSSLEAVETISSCTSHMRRIIDDILTLSKLDANLLKISPSPVDTGAFINTIQKMLEIDAERVGVVLQAQADASVSKLNAEWVEIDPGRVTQVCSARSVLGCPNAALSCGLWPDLVLV